MKKLLIVTGLIFFMIQQIIFSQWERIIEGEYTLNCQIKVLTSDPDSSNNIFVSQDTYLVFSSDYGKSWKIMHHFDERIDDIVVYKNNIYVLGDISKLYKSSDYGKNWIHYKPQGKILDDSISLCQFWNISIYNNILFLGTSYGYFFSSDDGLNWSCLVNCDDPKNIENLSYLSPSRSILFIENKIFFSNWNNCIVYSLDSGKTWVSGKNKGIKSKMFNILTFNNNIFVVWDSEKKFYISNDLAQSWQLLYEIFPPPVSSVRLESFWRCDDSFYFAKDSSIIFTSDFYKTFRKWDFLIKNQGSYYCDKIFQSGDYLFVHFTNSNRNYSEFYRAKLYDCMIDTTITSMEEFEVLENQFFLAPNPASDYIEINLQNVILSEAKNPEVKIYNTLGECVITVETQHAVSLQRIDVSHLPAGVYYIISGKQTRMFVKL